MPARTYFLSSSRVGFRPWVAADFALAKELWGDAAVTRYISKSPWTDAEVQERLELEIERGKTYGIQYWPIFELDSGRHIGCCGLRPYRADKMELELGFHLRPAFWGQGLATEAAATVIAYGLNELMAKAIYAGHHPHNVGSRAVLMKLGFRENGTEFFERTGLEHPWYVYSPPETAHCD